MMKDCIFCKILNEEIDSLDLYEDDLVKAFLDVNPKSNGHLLVVPKKHYENIFKTPDKVLKRINVVCKKMALLCKEKLNCKGVNIINASGKEAQQSVFHIHYHVLPRYKNDGIDLSFHGDSEVIKDIKETHKILKS
ncbi:MAG: HIT family protein [Candidatus Woesearchaeota archaeon]